MTVSWRCTCVCLQVRAGEEGALRTVSRAVSAGVGTAEAAPPAPRGFRPQDAAPSRLDFVWELPPGEANGQLTRFLLDYWPMNEPDSLSTIEYSPDGETHFPLPTTSITIQYCSERELMVKSEGGWNSLTDNSPSGVRLFMSFFYS